MGGWLHTGSETQRATRNAQPVTRNPYLLIPVKNLVLISPSGFKIIER